MTNERKVTMISGDILPAKNKSTLSQKDLDGIKNVFSTSVDKFKKSQDIVDSGDHSERRGKVAGAKNPEIHSEWESVKMSSKLEIGNLNDSKTIIPSRGSGETAEGGRGHLRGSITSIFNPTASEEVSNSEYTDHAIQAGKDKRTKASERTSKERSWEVISAAKNTKDTSPSELGFASLRSAYSQSEMPEVKISEVESMNKEKIENRRISQEALNIREQANKEERKDYESKLSDKRNWEDVVLDSIKSANDKTISVAKNDIKISQDFVREPKKVSDISFDGLFSIPQNPKEMEKEASIKRDSSNLQSRRTKREDDRSWETTDHAKGRKY